jgi:hypothetical protein
MHRGGLALFASHLLHYAARPLCARLCHLKLPPPPKNSHPLSSRGSGLIRGSRHAGMERCPPSQPRVEQFIVDEDTCETVGRRLLKGADGRRHPCDRSLDAEQRLSHLGYQKNFSDISAVLNSPVSEWPRERRRSRRRGGRQLAVHSRVRRSRQ